MHSLNTNFTERVSEREKCAHTIFINCTQCKPQFALTFPCSLTTAVLSIIRKRKEIAMASVCGVCSRSKKWLRVKFTCLHVLLK